MKVFCIICYSLFLLENPKKIPENYWISGRSGSTCTMSVLQALQTHSTGTVGRYVTTKKPCYQQPIKFKDCKVVTVGIFQNSWAWNKDFTLFSPFQEVSKRMDLWKGKMTRILSWSCLEEACKRSLIKGRNDNTRQKSFSEHALNTYMLRILFIMVRNTTRIFFFWSSFE